jgi:hypothetical protein
MRNIRRSGNNASAPSETDFKMVKLKIFLARRISHCLAHDPSSRLARPSAPRDFANLQVRVSLAGLASLRGRAVKGLKTSFKPMLRTGTKPGSPRRPEKSTPRHPPPLNQPATAFQAMTDQINTYAELREQIRAALRRQHPEWIDANGNSPLCDSYEACFAELLAIHATRERAAA